jgi:hypothetical protein
MRENYNVLVNEEYSHLHYVNISNNAVGDDTHVHVPCIQANKQQRKQLMG